MKEFLKSIVTARSGVSSKRVCGVLGWLTIIGVIIYCTIAVIQAPLIIDTFIIASVTLLGVDSVTGIWKNEKKLVDYLNKNK